MSNIKALSSTVWVIGVIAVVVIAAIIVGMSITAPPEAENPATVYIEGVKQAGNYTTPRSIEWQGVSPGNTYTKNFTVKSNSKQALLMKLYTTAPEGSAMSWAKNMTMLLAGQTVDSTLVLTVGEFPSAGQYTWMLLAVNGTAPTPTPAPTASPSPTATPEPAVLECTVQAESGCLNITVTNDAGQQITKQASDLPFTFLFKQGDTLEFTSNAKDGYEFNAWTLSDTTWYDDPDLILTNRQGNFTITAEYDDITG